MSVRESPSSSVIDERPGTEFVCVPLELVKTEPEDDPGVAESSLRIRNSFLSDTDPMNLLEVVDSRDRESDSEETREDSEKIRRICIDMQWEELTKMYPWLLREDEDENCCYCLYCNSNFTAKKEGQIHDHNRSYQHREREKNYLAFIQSEECSNERCIADIKKEHGISSIVSAQKIKRAAQTELMNNFNWKRWQEAHEWLERKESEGTVGYCKYCCINLNVGLSYVRERHERSNKHQEAEKIFNVKLDSNNEWGDNNVANKEDSTTEAEEDSDASFTAKENSNKWVVPCRSNMFFCKLCKTKLTKLSVGKHLKTKIHNLNLRSVKMEKVTHYNSNNEENEQQTSSEKDNTASTISENSSDDESVLNVDQAPIGERRLKKPKRGTDAWFEKVQKVYPWLQKHNKDPDYIRCSYCDIDLLFNTFQPTKHRKSGKHQAGEEMFQNNSKAVSKDECDFPWLVRSKKFPNQVCCKYCRVRYTKSSRCYNFRHEKSKRHQQCAQLYLAKGKQKLTPSKTVKSDSKTLAAAQSRIAWKSKFPWLIMKRIGMLPGYAYCKLCDNKIFVPTLKFASKHQRSLKHIRARIALRRQDKIKTKKKETAVYPWALPDTQNQAEYRFCKYCKTRILTGGEVKHQNSQKHINAEKQFLEETEAEREDFQASTNTNRLSSLRRRPDCDDEDLANPNKRTKLSHASAVEIANRLTAAHADILYLVRSLQTENGTEANARGGNLSGHIPLATQLGTFVKPITTAHNHTPSVLSATSERDSIELFFESMCASTKNLPADLAAEAKMKVMQLITDLELQALKRNQPDVQHTEESTRSAVTNGKSAELESTEQCVPNIKRALIAIDDKIDESASRCKSDVNHLGNKVDVVPQRTIRLDVIKQMVAQRNSGENSNQCSKMPGSNTSLGLPTQTSARNMTSTGVRCVPIQAMLKSPSKLKICSTSPVNNAKGDSKSVRHIQLNSRTETRFITVNPTILTANIVANPMAQRLTRDNAADNSMI